MEGSLVQGALFGAAFGTLGIIGHVFVKAIGTLFEAGKFFNAMHKISLASGISALTMFGFDVASLTAGAFNHDSPLYQFNKELHKSDLHNGLQLGASIVAVFTGAFYKGWKDSICFTAGTMVLTGAGLVAIETIKAGDKVIATNPDTNQTEEKTVVETYINKTECIVQLNIKNEVINTTKNHPCYVKEKGFVEACELSKGDEIMNASGGIYPVERIEFEDKEETVYNFQVEDYHTYYVGESSILVHNADCGNGSEAEKPDSPSQLQREVEKGQAPREVDRVDKAHNPDVPDQKPHVHLKDGTSLNNDGTVHDVHNGIPKISKEVLKWLLKHNWKGNK